MTLWTRIVRFVRSLFSRGESVEQLGVRLDESYRAQTKLLQQVRRGYADVDTSRKRVDLQLAQLKQQEAQADAEARDAVGRGDDAAARAALTRKLTLEKAEGELLERQAALKAEQDKLQLTVSQVERDIEDFRTRKDTLNARHAAASARAEINSATTGINAAGSAVGQAMSEAERRTRELESTADAVDELVAEGVISQAGEDPRVAEMRRFDAEAAEIDRQLAELHGPDQNAPEVTRGSNQVQE